MLRCYLGQNVVETWDTRFDRHNCRLWLLYQLGCGRNHFRPASITGVKPFLIAERFLSA